MWKDEQDLMLIENEFLSAYSGMMERESSANYCR